jgi:hypothetical protein
MCPVILNSACVFYEGESLIYTGINTNDSLQVALQKIDAALGVTTVVNIYNSDGTLTGNRTITSGGFTLTIGPVTTFTAAPSISTITQGSILFAGSGGTISQNNSQLFWDNSTNRLGLGIITPLYKLDVVGTVRISSTLEVNSLNGVGSRMVVANASGVLSTQAIPGTGVTSINTTGPITGGPITTTGTIGITQSTISTDGYLSSTDWNIFNNKQNALSLTTTGTSGASTLIGSVLNIPQYQSALTNPVTGTASIGQVAYWNSASSITGNNSLFWDIAGGSLGVGTNSLTGYGIRAARNITGAAISAGVYQSGAVQSDVATLGVGFFNAANVGAGVAANAYHHFRAEQSALGAGASLAFQAGFFVTSTLTSATNNYGFYGNLASAVGAWNIFMAGTAPNYFNGVVTIGTSTPNVSAKVQIDSTTQGFLPPRMTLVQKNAIATPAEGLIVYQTDGTKGLYLYDGASWRAITII